MRRRAVAIGAGVLVVAASAWWLASGRQTELLDSFADCSEQGYPVTDTDPPACSTGKDTILGPTRSPEPSMAPLTSQPFELLVDGDSGGNYAQAEQFIANLPDWQAYWRSVHGALPTLPPILPVDFRANNVIALSEGRQLTNGYTLKVTNISSSPGGTIVDYTISVPTATCPATNVPTNRYLIVRTGILPPPVSFRASKTNRQCGHGAP